jgi:hypothetical protein
MNGAKNIIPTARLPFEAKIKRPQPDLLQASIAMPADFSFPRAHTARIAAFCHSLLLIVGRDRFLWAGLPCLASVTLIGCVFYSRVY